MRLPLGPHGAVLKARDTWPRTAKVSCHPSQDWDDSVEVVERVSVRSCVRRGAAIEVLVDSHERYPWKFSAQQARTGRQALPAGEDAVESNGRIGAAGRRC